MNVNAAALSPFGVKTTGPTIHDLPEAVHAHLQERGQLRVYQQGQLVQSKGEPFTSVAWLQQGRLRTVVYMPDGSEQNRGWVMPGELFGIFNVLMDGCPALNTLVVDTEEAHILHFSREVLTETMRSQPDAGWGVLVALSRRIQQLDFVIELSGPNTLEDKLRIVLRWWANQHGIPARDGSVELWVTQNDLANGVGGSRQRVHMELQAMRDRDELELAYRKIILRPCFFDGLPHTGN
jgi:CRP/FNR family transcriptional regulator, cyclic AMP receptor protein